MRVLVTGGSGFIGQALIRALTERGDQVVALKHKRQLTQPGIETLEQLSHIKGKVDAVINLAGAPIADARWSEARKKCLIDSRLDTTRSLVQWIAKQSEKPSVFISGSAIGFYGATSSDTPVNEFSTPLLHDFSQQLCQQWEDQALEAQPLSVRVCLLRTGIVLGKGGALAKMRIPFLLGGGGPIASGKQWMSWIHLDDEVAAILHLLDHQNLSGAFNLTAPHPATNRQFVKSYAASLHRPAILPMPGFAVKMMLGSEASALLTEGLAVFPERLLESGFRFKYASLQDAFAALAAQHQ